MFCGVGGRKFLLTLTCELGCIALVWAGKISDYIFALVILGTVGAYIAGRSVHKSVRDSAKRVVP